MIRRQYKIGYDRQQGMLLPPRLEEYVAENNPVRAIDAYVETLDMAQLGFTKTRGGVTAGQPPYAPAMLLKLYLWGYLNRVRSSRRLEKETYRNLEVIWLLQGLHPCYRTIADFRKENAQALKAVYTDFLLVCRELELFGGELVGIDSVFLEGDASKASIYTKKRLEKLLACIEAEIAEYLHVLDRGDAQEFEMRGDDGDGALAEKLVQLQTRQQEYHTMVETLKDSDDTQVSRTDRDARLLTKKTDKGPTAGYNVQCAVDSKHKLIVAGEVVNDGNDTQQLAPMAIQAKENLGVETLRATADASYYTQQGVKACEDAGITPYVAIPDKNTVTRAQGRFERTDFSYEAETDTYRCPAGTSLVYTTTQQKNGKQMRRYISASDQCAVCPFKAQCLPGKTPYRQLYRWEHEAVVDRHRHRMAEEGCEYMRQRAGLVEHPFGTLKIWCGWTHFLVRGLDKVRGEMHLLLTCYNFKRVLNIIGPDAFRAYCQQRVNPPRQRVRMAGKHGVKSVLQGANCAKASGVNTILREVFEHRVFLNALALAYDKIVSFRTFPDKLLNMYELAYRL
jgi:transposase/IS5 family transposase